MVDAHASSAVSAHHNSPRQVAAGLSATPAVRSGPSSRPATGTRRLSVVGLAAKALLLVFAAATIAGAQENNYVLGAHDVLTITVFDQEDLSGAFTVDGDGSFTYPLIGRVNAAGLTLRQLEAELKKRLAAGYLKNPQLSVKVDEYRSKRVFIVGEVRQPGTYTLMANTSLIEALSRAGSTTADAIGEVVVVRGNGGGESTGPVLPDQAQQAEVVRVDLKELEAGVLSKNVNVRDGDTIFVPRGEKIYVSGQVKSPGAYSIQKGTTLLQVLSLAGGVTDRGASGRTKVIRIVGGQKKEFKLKLDDVVEPGDTIVVPERYF
jgi:polysaccharide export outer membrane protein